MMRSLAFKWIASLLLTSLVGVILVGLFAYRITLVEYDRLRVAQAQAEFIATTTSYYQTYQTWDGLDEQQGQSYPSPDTSKPYKPHEQFALVDTNGEVVVGHGPFQHGEQISPQKLEEGTPITVDGEHIGTVLLASPPPELDPREQRYLEGTYQALLVGAVGAGATALLIGILLSRHFLRPLSELTQAITAMQRGDLNQQVQVRTQDELGSLARTFNQMSAEIHRANQLRQQMTADIAHDLRTPLMVISGYVEALRDGTLQPTQERFEALNQETVLLKRLIEDLRTLSLADAGELKLVYQPVQPRELLEQVKQSFQPIADEQQVVLRVETVDELPTLQIDRERMMQVLANLLTNALRYTSTGGVVTLRAQCHQEKLQLAVADTGSGIPEDSLLNIFERFYRADQSRHESQNESGLGLAIAKSIVEAHHGTIVVESKLGKGTVMTVTLPLQRA